MAQCEAYRNQWRHFVTTICSICVMLSSSFRSTSRSNRFCISVYRVCVLVKGAQPQSDAQPVSTS